METLQRKQMLKNNLIEFTKNTNEDINVYSVQTDINKGYWIYKGIIFDNKVFNLHAATKIKPNTLKKDIVYYVSIIQEKQRQLFNIL